MSKVLKGIVWELNPVRDFDRFKFYRPGEVFLEEDTVTRFENIRSNGRFLFWVPKHMLRGIVLGAAMGGLAGLLSDKVSHDEISTACVVGARYGFQIDVLQYLVRGAYHLFMGNSR